MDIGFEGEAYPSRDERELFGYRPNSIYVLARGFENLQTSQSFRGDSAQEVIEGLEDALIGFEYLNEDVSQDRNEDGEEDVVEERSVPMYQQEVVPAELSPESNWVSSLHEIEGMNEDVADTFFSATIHDNSGYFRRVDEFAEELAEPTVTAAPDIQGVHALSYATDRREATLIQYMEELEVPEEPTQHPPGAMISDVDYRKVEYPRDEEKISELVENHENWEVEKTTLPVHEIPPELSPGP